MWSKLIIDFEMIKILILVATRQGLYKINKISPLFYFLISSIYIQPIPTKHTNAQGKGGLRLHLEWRRGQCVQDDSPCFQQELGNSRDLASN